MISLTRRSRRVTPLPSPFEQKQRAAKLLESSSAIVSPKSTVQAKPSTVPLAPPTATTSVVSANPTGPTAEWVYGIAAVDIESSDGTRLATKGDRMVFGYPMRRDDDTGEVSMRARIADPVTAQLREDWVVVYAPDALVPRRVVDFCV